MFARLFGKKHTRKTAAEVFSYPLKEQRVLGFEFTMPIYLGDEAFKVRVSEEQLIALATGKAPSNQK